MKERIAAKRAFLVEAEQPRCSSRCFRNASTSGASMASSSIADGVLRIRFEANSSSSLNA